MEFARIVFTCVVMAVLYGIIHDQITVRICLEYFSVFHPPIFPTNSPTLLALGWGVTATWWAGLLLGFLVALAAQAGRRPKLALRDLLKPMVALLLTMAGAAFLAGISGFILARRGLVTPPVWVASRLDAASHAGFIADLWAHTASYASAFGGGVILCGFVWRSRRRLAVQAADSERNTR